MSYKSSSNPATLLVSTENTGINWYATADGYNQSGTETITLSDLTAGESYSYYVNLTEEEAYIVGIQSVALTYEQNEIDCSEGEQTISPTLAISYLMSDGQSLAISYTDSSDENYDLAQEWLTSDGATITYSITEDESNGDLEINSSTGEVTYNGSGTICNESVTVTVTGTCSDGLEGSVTDSYNISVVDNTVYYTVAMECYDQDYESLSGCSMYYRTSSSGSYTTYSSSFTVAENTTVYYYATLDDYTSAATSSSPAKVTITEDTTIKIYLSKKSLLEVTTLASVAADYGSKSDDIIYGNGNAMINVNSCGVDWNYVDAIIVDVLVNTSTSGSTGSSGSYTSNWTSLAFDYIDGEMSSTYTPIVLTQKNTSGSVSAYTGLNSGWGFSYCKFIAYSCSCTTTTTSNSDGTTTYTYTYTVLNKTASQDCNVSNSYENDDETMSTSYLTGNSTIEKTIGSTIYTYSETTD